MVEETCRDYAKYLQEINFKKEVNVQFENNCFVITILTIHISNIAFQIEPICSNVDEILTRMEEFESSLIIVSSLWSTTHTTLLCSIA